MHRKNNSFVAQGCLPSRLQSCSVLWSYLIQGNFHTRGIGYFSMYSFQISCRLGHFLLVKNILHFTNNQYWVDIIECHLLALLGSSAKCYLTKGRINWCWLGECKVKLEKFGAQKARFGPLDSVLWPLYKDFPGKTWSYLSKTKIALPTRTYACQGKEPNPASLPPTILRWATFLLWALSPHLGSFCTAP